MDGYLDVRTIFSTIDKNNHGYLSVRINGDKINVIFSCTVKNTVKYHRDYETKVFHYDDSETWKVTEIFEIILDRIESPDKTVLYGDIIIDMDHNCKSKRTEIKTGIQLVQIFDFIVSEISGELW